LADLKRDRQEVLRQIERFIERNPIVYTGANGTHSEKKEIGTLVFLVKGHIPPVAYERFRAEGLIAFDQPWDSRLMRVLAESASPLPLKEYPW
jgi:hypothetical protein